MAGWRCCLLRGRMLRLPRGPFLFTSLALLLVTLLAFYKIEVPYKLPADDIGKSANRILQQLDDACNGINCSNSVKDATEAIFSSSGSTQEAGILVQNDLTPKIADLLPEEAIPEELVPDQEPPALLMQPKPTSAKVTQSPVTLPAKDHLPTQEQPEVHEEEHEQQQQQQEQQQRTAVPITPSSTKAPPPAKPPSKQEQVKVHIKSISSVSRSSSKVSSQGKVEQLPENPPILTKLLYEPGHMIKAPEACPNQGDGLKLLILVTTATSHVKEREAVRGTWGHVALRRDVGFAFFVGRSSSAADNELVRQESQLYGDVIQGNFFDTYNNLTLKSISMLEWVSTYCPKVKYFLKTDDDMYINIPQLFRILDKGQHQRTIMGKLAKQWKPIRNTTSKYYISPRLFEPKVYPDFNTGPAYVITSDIVGDLYRKSLEEKFFKLEDVYLTGMIASQLQVKRINYAEFINRRVKLETCAVKKAVSIHMVKPHEMYDLWKRVSDGLTTCK